MTLLCLRMWFSDCAHCTTVSCIARSRFRDSCLNNLFRPSLNTYFHIARVTGIKRNVTFLAHSNTVFSNRTSQHTHSRLYIFFKIWERILIFVKNLRVFHCSFSGYDSYPCMSRPKNPLYIFL